MRKVIVLLLTLVFFCSATCTTFGAVTYDVSLDSIDKIVSNNSTLSAELRDKLYREQADSQANINKVMSEIYAKQLEIKKVNKDDFPTEEEYKKALADLNKELSSLNEQVNELQYQLRYSINQLQMSNGTALVQQGEVAKEEYLKYLDTLRAKKDFDEKLAAQKEKLSIAEKKYKRGLISANALRQEKEAVEDLEDQASDFDETILEGKDGLINALGVQEDSILNIGPVSIEYNAYYTQAKLYNLDSDLRIVLNNSFEIKMARATVEYYRYKKDSYSEYTQAIKDKDAVERKVAKSFKSQYKQLQKSIVQIEKHDKKINRAKQTLRTAKKKYKYGLISRNDYKSVRAAYLSAVREKNDQIAQLLPTILKYQLTKKGY